MICLIKGVKKGIKVGIFMVRLQFDDRQFKITLPKQIVLAKRWAKGDRLVVEIDDRGDIVLRKATED